MMVVSLLYVVLWAPGYLHNLIVNVYNTLKWVTSPSIIIMVLGLLYICVNPFIYATNFDPVKQVVLRMIPWKRNTHPLESYDMT